MQSQATSSSFSLGILPIAFLILAAASSYNFCSQPAKGEGEGIRIEVLQHTDETDQDLEYLRRGIATIPMSVQNQVNAAGLKVVLTPRFIFDAPESSGEKVFRNGQTTDNVGGEFQPGKKRVIIPERASWGNSPPRPQGNYIVKVVRHELGHAWDHARGGISKSQGYLAAYDTDFGHLGGEQKRKWAYYITGTSSGEATVPTASGRGELIASLLASLCTPIEWANKKEKDLLEDFPHVTAYLKSIEPSLDGLPKHDQAEQAVNRESAVIPASSIEQSTNGMQKAIALLDAKRYSDAQESLTLAIKQNPSNARAYILRGNADMWLIEYKRAIEDYTSYIKLNRSDPQGFELRAKAYGWLGESARQHEDEQYARRLSRNAGNSDSNKADSNKTDLNKSDPHKKDGTNEK